MDFSILTTPEALVSLGMLTFMEIVLGIDNIIFISISANKLPESERQRATNIGLVLAMVFRIILLFGISYLIAMQKSLIHIDFWGMHGDFTGQSLILIAGGLFLLYKSTSEIHHKLEGEEEHSSGEGGKSNKKGVSLTNIIIQISIINIVFSFDSILTAIGLTDHLIIMIIAVILSMAIMMIFANPVGRFVNKNPTVQILGLTFLILIGFMLVTEGAHLAHFEIFGSKVGQVPKGYLYFTIFFSLGVEFLNMQLRQKKKENIQLRGIGEQAAKQGII